MKKFSTYLLPLVLLAMVLGGCSKNEEQLKGNVDFGMTTGIESALKAGSVPSYDVSAALITVTDFNGNIVFEKKQLEFYSFGDVFITNSVSLEVGKYQLTEFFLIDSSGTVIWATPVEGSHLASLVEDPVPINFRIDADRTTHVVPEVVRVGSHNPSDFGYVDFIVNFVERFCVWINYESPCMDWYGPEDSLSSPYIPQPAILEVFTRDGMVLRKPLIPGDNHIQIPRGYPRYKFVVHDCGGICYSESLEATELIMHSCFNGDPLLIFCDPQPSDIIITPEGLKEPDIGQGVFGQVAQMGWETDEFIPLVRDIHFFHYPEDDSLIHILGGTDCYIHQEIWFPPVGIVRSNTDGYFQIPLDAGKYLYMVETPNGYYIDMYISSRLPGEAIVKENEVTKLDIIIYPCD